MEDLLAAAAGGASEFKPSSALAKYRKSKEASKEKDDFSVDPDGAAERKVAKLQKKEKDSKKGASSLSDLIRAKGAEKKKISKALSKRAKRSAAPSGNSSPGSSDDDLIGDSKQFKEHKRKREDLDRSYKKYSGKKQKGERATSSRDKPVFSDSDSSSSGAGLSAAAKERLHKKCKLEKQVDAEEMGMAQKLKLGTDRHTRRKIVAELVKMEDVADSTDDESPSSGDDEPVSAPSTAMKSEPVSAPATAMKNVKSAKEPVDFFEKALEKYSKHTLGPERKAHKWIPRPADLADVKKKFSIPMKELRWTKNTLKTYEQEFARYHVFCNAFEVCSLPESVSVWSIQSYAELLAKTNGFSQSRAVYFSHWKSYVSSAAPFTNEMNAAYSKAFSILSKLVKPRSQAQGVRLSHLLRMTMLSDDLLKTTVYTRKAKAKTKTSPAVKEVSISYKQALKWYIKCWFGMLRLGDAIHAELTTTSGGAGIKFHVKESKGDKHAHGATFKLACACKHTCYGPWREDFKVCPVHACSDEEFVRISGVLGTADQARKMWKAVVVLAGEDCIPGVEPARLQGHALRVGSITAALQSGLSVEVVCSLARHRQIQTTQDYATAALTDPDEIEITWPVARGTSIRDACKK
eukprot:g8539.t1